MSEKIKKVPKLRFPEFTDTWEQCKLGEVVEWKKGNGLSKNKLNKDKIGNNVIHYADLYTFSAIVNENISWSMSDEGVLIPNNSLLFPMSDVTSNGLARTTTVMKAGVKAGSDILIGTLKENLCSKFLSLQINYYSRKILPLITGTTVRHISSVNLSTLEISISTLLEQKKIGNFFKTFDDLITIHQRKLKNLKKLKKSLLQKMFPKNGSNFPEVRFPEFTTEWEQCKLGDIAKYKNGKAHENNIIENGEYIVVNSKFISTNGEIRKYTNKIIEPLYKNEITFVLSDVPNGKALAKTYLIEENDRYTLNQRIAGITPKNKVQSIFLNLKLNRNSYFLKFDDGSKQTNLSKSDVLNYIDNYPSILEQEKIGNFFKSIDEIITIHQRKLENLKRLKKGLLQQMFI